MKTATALSTVFYPAFLAAATKLLPLDLTPIDSTIKYEQQTPQNLEAIFADPVNPGISWADIEGVFRGCGGIIKEGRGSRVWFIWEEQVAVFHRPHPQPNTDKGAVKSVRRFFATIGLKP